MQKLIQMRNKKGFTLVELIVVIVIIAILAAVAVPMFTKYVQDAKYSQTDSAVTTVQTAVNAAFSSGKAAITSTSKLKSNFENDLKAILNSDKYTISFGADATAKTTVAIKGAGTLEFTTVVDTTTAAPTVTVVTGSGFETRPPAPSPAP